MDLYFIMEDLHAASAVDADADVEFLGFVHRDIEEIRSGQDDNGMQEPDRPDKSIASDSEPPPRGGYIRQ